MNGLAVTVSVAAQDFGRFAEPFAARARAAQNSTEPVHIVDSEVRGLTRTLKKQSKDSSTLEQALNSLGNELDRLPTSPDLWCCAGSALNSASAMVQDPKRKQLLGTARLSIETALQLNRRVSTTFEEFDLIPLFVLGQICIKLGDPHSAENHFKTILEHIDPLDRGALQQLNRMRWDWEKWFGNLVATHPDAMSARHTNFRPPPPDPGGTERWLQGFPALFKRECDRNPLRGLRYALEIIKACRNHQILEVHPQILLSLAREDIRHKNFAGARIALRPIQQNPDAIVEFAKMDFQEGNTAGALSRCEKLFSLGENGARRENEYALLNLVCAYAPSPRKELSDAWVRRLYDYTQRTGSFEGFYVAARLAQLDIGRPEFLRLMEIAEATGQHKKVLSELKLISLDPNGLHRQSFLDRQFTTCPTFIQRQTTVVRVSLPRLPAS